MFIMQLPPPVHGVSVMSKLIKDSRLLNDTFKCDYINLATASSVDNLQKNSASKYFLTLSIYFKVIAKLFSTRYSKVYITLFPYGFSFYKDGLVILLCRLFGYKPLVHLHTYGFKKTSEKSKFRKRIYRYIFKKTEVICLSDLLVEDIEDLYEGKVYILPNGIPQVNFENNYSVKEENPVRLLYLSNLIKGKGILVLMDAVCLLKRSGYRFHLRVAGSEHDVTYSMLEEFITKNDLKDEVSLVGPKFNEDKFEEFRSADIFILPSNYDTFGLVLLEAMQFGVPCISTRMGAIPEVLGEDRGIVIPEINPEELEKAILFLIKNPDKRKTMSTRSFEYYKSHYTVPVFEKGMLAILNGQPLHVNKRLDNKL